MATLGDVTAIGDMVHFFQWAKARSRELGSLNIRTADGNVVSGNIVHGTKDFIIVGDMSTAGLPLKAHVVMLSAVSSVEIDSASKPKA
jgi:hypothetical protein